LHIKKQKKDHQTDLLDLGLKPVDNFIGYDEPYSDYTKKIITSMASYDAYIICSPVYNGMISAPIKNLFEHLSNKGYEGKTASFILMAGGKISYLRVQDQLSGLMTYFSRT